MAMRKRYLAEVLDFIKSSALSGDVVYLRNKKGKTVYSARLISRRLKKVI